MNDDRVFKKCALRLLPFVALLYMVNYIDRVNVGYAALTMNKDLGLSPSQFGFGAGIFFFIYALSQIPGARLVARLGPRRGMFAILLVWGAISAANALAFSPVSFYVLRFALGVAEAAFFPTMIFYLSSWFPTAYLGRCIGLFMASNPLAIFVGASLSGVLLGLDGLLSLRGWQWLFIAEGLPACLLSFAVYRFLPDGPQHASWLSAEEKSAITTRLNVERSGAETNFRAVFFDRRVYAVGCAGACLLSCQYGVQLWVPQILQGMGYSNVVVGQLVGGASALAVVTMILWSYSSDRHAERVWHFSIAALFAAAGLFAAAVSQSNALILLGLAIGIVGQFAALPLQNTLTQTFLRGPALAGGVALYNTMAQLGGAGGSQIMGLLKQQTGSYTAGLLILAMTMIAAAAIVTALGRVMEAGVAANRAPAE